MIKVSDYLVKRLEEHGVKDLFMISGGGAMHLNDAVGKSKKIKYYCNHHEQAGAIAAEGYARTTGNLGVVVVTSGPGGTNTLTGVLGEWLDSVPVLYISGQVKYDTTIEAYPELGLRQLGDQEINIIDIVKPITKFASMVIDPLDIKRLIDKAIHLATSGRPGPVWLDIPLNVQAAMIDENELNEYDAKEEVSTVDMTKTDKDIIDAVEMLKVAERPVILAGHGIRISEAQKEFRSLIETLKIPVIPTFNGFDLLESDSPYYAGRIGTIGQRSGNFALQNSDLIISIGSRNNIRQISYNWENFGRAAKKIVVDIDPAELKKPTIKPDLAINADAKLFILKLLGKLQLEKPLDHSKWLEWCIVRRGKYPVVLPEYKKISDLVHPYYFMETLTTEMHPGDIAVAGNGSACVTLFQAGIVKKGQRIFWNSGCASMGYDLPAAIGAAIGSGGKSTVCLAGDGSLQMNIQELQTLKQYNLPVKIFYLNNEGYISIKQTQDNFFPGNRVACGMECGVSFPDIVKVAAAYGIKSVVIGNHKEMDEKIKEVLNANEPVICEVKLIPNYIFSPKLSSEKKADGRLISKPLEDMYPFLSREEFMSNMIIEPMKE